MRIKQLELKGFKSFKKRTVIRFGEGTSGIVGPNGCGKSNVVDAFLWVMGETAPSHLRGSSMEDLIFSGTGKYPPSGIAEVSLVMEPSAGKNPLSSSKNSFFNKKYSEIMLTRRLDRDGKSEYLINSQPCRLKDVQELFMDTGAGIHSFSFIEQGAVENFISSKPEQKRLLIESTAGISKFRSRKKSAEKKLELTEGNLKRLKDILSQQNSQLEKLKKQSKKAEQFRNLKKQIREKDLQISKWNLSHIQTEKKSLDKQIHEENKKNKIQKKELEQTRTKADQLQTVYKSKKIEVEKAEIETQSLRNQFVSLEKELAALKASIQVHQQNLSPKSIQLYQQNRQAILNQIEKSEPLISQLNKKQRDLDEKWQQANKEYETISANVSAVNIKKQSLKTELINYAHQEALSKEREQSVFEKIKDLNQNEEEWNQALQKKSKELKELQSQKKLLTEELENKKQLSFNLINSAQELKKDVDSFKREIQAQESLLKKEQEEASALYSEWNSLKKLESRINDQEKGIQTILQSQEYKNSFIETASEIRVLSPLLEKAISSYMNLRLKSVFCHKQDSIPPVLDLLNQQKIGRCRFLLPQKKSLTTEPSNSHLGKQIKPKGFVGSPLEKSLPFEKNKKPPQKTNQSSIKEEPGFKFLVTDQVEGHAELIDLLLSNTAMVEDAKTAFQLKEKYPNWCFLTPEGEVLTKEGDFIGGTFNQEDMNILSYHRAIKELPLQYKNKKKQVDLMLENLKKKQKLFEKSTNTLSTLNKEEGHFQISILKMEKDIEGISRDQSRLNSDISYIQKKLMECEKKRQELQKQKNYIQNQHGSTRQETLTQELKTATADYERKTQEKHILSKQKDQLWREITSCEKDLSMIKEKQSLLKQSFENEKQAEKTALSLSQEQKTWIQTYEKQLKEKEQQWDSLHQKLKAQEEQVTTLIKKQEKTNEEINQTQSSIIYLQETLVAQESTIHSLNLQLESLLLKKSSLLERISEKYQINLESVKETEGGINIQDNTNNNDLSFDRDKEEEKLQKLNKNLSYIGEVNLLALKEYEELVEENSFYQKQYEDLCSAKEKLSQAIKRIDSFCSKKFAEVFEQVNSIFSKVWPSLFEGGKAEMILVKDPEKDIEGLDIMVQPPGKKVQNMSLLSGGEKAMTAVAVIFSIFLVKPSPFCILDEVDAPLDDVNIVRFNSLLSEMAKASQVIIITHNKYTMKSCSHLYGVTMEEKGISKIMSLNMQSHRTNENTIPVQL